MALARKLATYEDTLAYPEGTRTEILAGEILVQPGPSNEHQYFQAGMSRRVGGPFGSDRTPGGWWILPDVDVRFTLHDVVRPDHSGWRRTRLASPFGKRPIDVIPDWICEILSPSNFRHDRGRKSDLYAAHGVGHLWIVDPLERLLEAYALQSGRWLRLAAYDDTVTARIPPFEAIELDVGELFPPLDALPR
jgi:Uma2 family endonuclease